MSELHAFPNPALADTQHCSSERLNDSSQYGMTLRDYFAAKAMQGFLSANNHAILASELSIYEVNERLCKYSYEIADAMLKARG